MRSGTRLFWYQKLGPSRTMFYSSPETWMHVTQMQRCHWPLRFEYTWYIVHAVHRLQMNSRYLLYLFINNYCAIFMLINSDGLQWLESHFNAGPATFWPSQWTDEIGDAMFLVPVSRVSCAKLGHKFLVTSFWSQKLGRRTWVVCHGPNG